MTFAPVRSTLNFLWSCAPTPAITQQQQKLRSSPRPLNSSFSPSELHRRPVMATILPVASVLSALTSSTCTPVIELQKYTFVVPVHSASKASGSALRPVPAASVGNTLQGRQLIPTTPSSWTRRAARPPPAASHSHTHRGTPSGSRVASHRPQPLQASTCAEVLAEAALDALVFGSDGRLRETYLVTIPLDTLLRQ